MSSSPNARACLFVIFILECDEWGRTLEEALALGKEPVDAIAVNGEMDKEDNSFFIGLFTTATSMPCINPCVFVATDSDSTDIDQEDLLYLSRVGIPRCILTGK